MYSATTSFYLFQKHADFENAGQVLIPTSSSLGCGSLAPHSDSGSQLEFKIDKQIFVGAISSDVSSQSNTFVSEISPNIKEDISLTATAHWPIGLSVSNSDTTTANSSVLTVNQLGLSQPTNSESVPKGAFGITVPSYTTSQSLKLYVGNATEDTDGLLILSSFITPSPVSNIYCSPSPIFYVKVGHYRSGKTIIYSEDNAGICDFTNGYTSFSVTYENDGNFTSTGR